MKLKYYSGAQVTSNIEKLPSKEYLEMLNAFAKEPSADVRENVHAHWKPVHLTAFGVCSACGAKWQFTELMSFCPNCGADMVKLITGKAGKIKGEKEHEKQQDEGSTADRNPEAGQL